MAPTTLLFALLALGLPLQSTAQLFGDDFLRWFWQTSVIDGNYLYISGGEIWTSDTSSTSPNNPGLVNYDHGVHVIDISQSWTTSTVTQIDTPTQDTNLKTRRPSMYNDPVAKSVNIYGGWPYITDPNFVPYVASWPDNSGPNLKAHANFGNDADVGFAFTRKTFGLTAVSDKAYYNLGGVGTADTDPKFEGLPAGYMFTESGLLEFDFENKTWTNHTTTFSRVNGEAQFLPMFGDEGVIAFIGGDKPTGSEYPAYSTSLVDMTTITIYDIASQKYFDQATTGASPLGRTLFCSVGVVGPANKTFDIYIFGGYISDTMTTAQEADMGTIYILSLPSFTWTKTTVSSAWRYSNHCRVLGQSQMLNVGGVGSNFTAPDTFSSGLGIFNLNTQTWTNSYDPNADAYSPPSSISGLYNSDGSPKNAVKYSDTALKTIFGKATTTSSSNSSSSSSGSSTSSTASSSSPATSTTKASAKKTPAGAIAGGVIGGIAIIAVVGGLAFYCLRRHRRGPDYKNANAPPVEMQGSGAGFYASKPQGPTSEMGTGNMSYPAEMSSPNSGDSAMHTANGYGHANSNGNNPGGYYSPDANGYAGQQHHAGGVVGPDGQMYQLQTQGPRLEVKAPVGMTQATQVHELG